MSRPSIIETPAGPAQLKRSQRKTLAISVLPDGALELIAPKDAAVEEVIARVARRHPWIRTQRQKFLEMNSSRPPLRYVNGATHRYLGRQYRLKIVKGSATHVALKGAFFWVEVPKLETLLVGDALQKWYRKRAQEVFSKRMAGWREWCRNRKLAEPRVCLRVMAKRWGSARPDGTISLNPDLIRAPSICIDYVIAHEICHLRHPNHGAAFLRQLTSLFPNWRNAKARLERAEF